MAAPLLKEMRMISHLSDSSFASASCMDSNPGRRRMVWMGNQTKGILELSRTGDLQHNLQYNDQRISADLHNLGFDPRQQV
jgi:hypothetical protein